jgi:hypothetical protein
MKTTLTNQSLNNRLLNMQQTAASLITSLLDNCIRKSVRSIQSDMTDCEQGTEIRSCRSLTSCHKVTRTCTAKTKYYKMEMSAQLNNQQPSFLDQAAHNSPSQKGGHIIKVIMGCTHTVKIKET